VHQISRDTLARTGERSLLIRSCLASFVYIGHELLDRVRRCFVGAGGQVGVDRGGGWRAMAKVLLNQAQVDAGFQQMRRIGVPLMPSSALAT
jgi:hypothetical protein